MQSDLRVYYSPSCAFSMGTVSFLVGRGADFRLVNLEENAAEKARLEKRLAGRKLETPALEAGAQLTVAPSVSPVDKPPEARGLTAQAAPPQQPKKGTKRSSAR